jgi:hypothetical protein
MNKNSLVDGYRHVLNTIYSPKYYYERVKTLLKEFKPRKGLKLPEIHLDFGQLLGLIIVSGLWG